MSASDIAAKVEAWRHRLDTLAVTLGAEPHSGTLSEQTIGEAALRLIDPLDPSQVWLALAVTTAVLPKDSEVASVARASEFDGGDALRAHIVVQTSVYAVKRAVRIPPPGTVLIDVSNTVAVPFQTGIQRVVRETTPRWLTRPEAEAVTWDKESGNLRPLAPREAEAIAKRVPLQAWERDSPEDVPKLTIVPWKCVLITAEVFMEQDRIDRTRAIALHARARSAAVVHDCSPVTLAETRVGWKGDTFPQYLTALARFDQLVADSVATMLEFRGWRHAHRAVGLGGPAVDEVCLPADITPPSADELARGRDLFEVLDLPIVLVVGSREPRKNHLAVLHAAELVWRRGHDFTLLFLGGRSWESGLFGEQVDRLRSAGRHIDIVSSVTDAQIAAAYKLARFSLFPSLSEGFGLPVAESLALGTPVITSNFGSMKEIADGGGALLVDPRDDHDIADAMQRLLADDELLGRLRREAEARAPRTWDQYCDEAWNLLVGSNDRGD